MLSLNELQKKFQQLVTQPSDELLAEAAPFLRETVKVPLRRRVRIYQYAYCARIEESLHDDYPRLKKAMGVDAFNRLLKDYLRLQPSRFTGLAEVSEGLSDFLLTQVLPQRELYSEIARWEWNIILSSLTEDSVTRNLEQMADLSESELAQNAFILNPSARFFDSSFAVHRAEAKPRPTSLILFSRYGRTWSRRLVPWQRVLLSAIHKGTPIACLNDCTSGVKPETLNRSFSTWAQQGLIVAFRKLP